MKVRRGGEDLEIYAHNGKEVVSLEEMLRQKERDKEAKKRELAAKQERERQQAAHAAQQQDTCIFNLPAMTLMTLSGVMSAKVRDGVSSAMVQAHQEWC